jgi:hypothetical protein
MSAILKRQGVVSNDFNDQELNYLLSMISKTTFEGRNVFLVAEIVNKINSKIESNEARDRRSPNSKSSPV